jgi:hypothetical protein
VFFGSFDVSHRGDDVLVTNHSLRLWKGDVGFEDRGEGRLKRSGTSKGCVLPGSYE